MKEKYAVKKMPAGLGDASFLDVMLKDPQEAVRWAGSVAKNPELSAWGLAICQSVELAPGAPQGWGALDGARLSYLAVGRIEPALGWLAEGERGYRAALDAASRASDHGIDADRAKWLFETMSSDAGFESWISGLDSQSAVGSLDMILGGGRLAAGFQEPLARRLSPAHAWDYLKGGMGHPHGGRMSGQSALIAARAAFSDPKAVQEALRLAFYKGFDKLSDAAGAALVQALSEAEIPRTKENFAAFRALGPLSRAWDELSDERFVSGVAWARWAAKLGGAGRWLPEKSYTAGGGMKWRARTVLVARLEGSYHHGGLYLGNGNLASAALALQSGWALRELMKLGWALPSKSKAKEMAGQLREFARSSAQKSKRPHLRWIGDERDQSARPEIEQAGDAMLALWEKTALEAQGDKLSAAPLSSAKRRRPGL